MDGEKRERRVDATREMVKQGEERSIKGRRARIRERSALEGKRKMQYQKAVEEKERRATALIKRTKEEMERWRGNVK